MSRCVDCQSRDCVCVSPEEGEQLRHELDRLREELGDLQGAAAKLLRAADDILEGKGHMNSLETAAEALRKWLR